MRLTEEQALQDDKRYASCNMLAELKYCGWDIPHRKSITNDEIHFYAWLCRSAVALLKEQQPKPVAFTETNYQGFPVSHCPTCNECIDIKAYGGTKQQNFCPYCGQAVKWDCF